MSRFSAFCTISALVAMSFVGCNSDDVENIYDDTLNSSTIIESFSLSANKKVLPNLDKVFFNIDLAKAQIFNADSLPYGTKVNKLVVNISTGGCSALELIVKRENREDTTYNYLTNSTDSIDFTNPVTLRITSQDAKYTMDYTVKVNVHKMVTDSMAWGDMAYAKLPTNLSKVALQHTVKFQGKAYCLTTDGNDNYCLAETDSPANNNWDKQTLAFSFIPMVETFRASTKALYILDDQHNLYRSEDCGVTWADASCKMDNIIGGYNEDMFGTILEGGQWYIVSTGGYREVAPAGFPVSGASTPIEYSFPMGKNHQITITGGQSATGEYLGSSWGFDGSNWANLTVGKLPYPVENATAFPYFVFEENNYFIATEYSMFVTLGGRMADAAPCDTIYISYDYGMNWKKANQLMQLPANVPPMIDAQALVFTQEITSRDAIDSWNPIEMPMLPLWLTLAEPQTTLTSRVSTEITSWKCPYVYVFGGEDEQGNTYDTVWRAVINRLTFKPIQ